jgi:hypothetical protein
MGKVFRLLGHATQIGAGVWGMYLCLGVVFHNLGAFATVIAFFIFPGTLFFVPLYELFANSNWLPAAVSYGGATASFLLIMAGVALDDDA